MGTGENMFQSTYTYLSEIKEYYRYSDHAVVKARLVEIDGKKLMQIREKFSEHNVCSGCGLLLSVRFDRNVPTYLPPVTFHERHRPLKEEK